MRCPITSLIIAIMLITGLTGACASDSSRKHSCYQTLYYPVGCAAAYEKGPIRASH